MNHQAPSPERGATPEQLAVLAPLGAMSAGRLREIADIAVVEHAARGSDPLAAHSSNRHSVFLLRGEMLLVFEGGGTLVVVGGMGDGRHPLNRRAAKVARSRAISDVELLIVEDEALDILVTFDQVASGDAASGSAMAEAVRSGDVIIREGEEGDFYYVIETGRCQVERTVGGVSVALAELKSGDAFGEEGPQRVQRGAAWLDVRYPSEYRCGFSVRPARLQGQPSGGRPVGCRPRAPGGLGLEKHVKNHEGGCRMTFNLGLG